MGDKDNMMNALHLIWIIPLSVSLGYAIAALMVAASRADTKISKKEEEYERIYIEDEHQYSGLLSDD